MEDTDETRYVYARSRMEATIQATLQADMHDAATTSDEDMGRMLQVVAANALEETTNEEKTKLMRMTFVEREQAADDKELGAIRRKFAGESSSQTDRRFVQRREKAYAAKKARREQNAAAAATKAKRGPAPRPWHACSILWAMIMSVLGELWCAFTAELWYIQVLLVYVFAGGADSAKRSVMSTCICHCYIASVNWYTWNPLALGIYYGLWVMGSYFGQVSLYVVVLGVPIAYYGHCAGWYDGWYTWIKWRVTTPLQMKEPDAVPRQEETAPEEKDTEDPNGRLWRHQHGVHQRWSFLYEEPGARGSRFDMLGAMMKDAAFDINTTECGSDGQTALWFALGRSFDPYDEKAVNLILGVPSLDINATGRNEGQTPLLIWECSLGRSRNVELLLTDSRVDPNRIHPSTGYTPLATAALLGHNKCVELLLGDMRVDVCGVTSAAGNTPLIAACNQIAEAMGKVGEAGDSDPARTLVNLLKSRRIPKHHLKETIAWMRQHMPKRSKTAATAADTSLQKAFRLVLPVLMAQDMGEFRWCGHCYKLTPDQNLNRCGGCKQFGYCGLPDEYVLKHMHHPRRKALLDKKPCHVAHWSAGHKKECARFAAEAEAEAKANASTINCPPLQSGNSGGGGSQKEEAVQSPAEERAAFERALRRVPRRGWVPPTRLEAFYYWSDTERNKAGESLQECYDKYGTGGWESAAKDMRVQLVFLDATRDDGCSWLAQMVRPSTGEYANVRVHENTDDTFKKKGSLVPCEGNVGTEGKAGGDGDGAGKKKGKKGKKNRRQPL